MISNRIKTLECPDCGCTHFLQKQIWKSGVRVIDGRAVFDPAHKTARFTILYCQNCSAMLAETIVKLIVPLAEDHQLRN